MLGKGRILLTNDLSSAFAAQDVPRGTMVESGVDFVRRADDRGKTYFVVNRTAAVKSLWLPLAVSCENAVIFDPRLTLVGTARTRTETNGTTEIRVDVEPGGTRIIQTFDAPVDYPPWPYLEPAGESVRPEGPWAVTFVKGGPEMPAGYESQEPVPWSNRGDGRADAFSGMARYETRFRLPETDASEWDLDLGEVYESAEVFVNGKSARILWCEPYRVAIGHLLKPGENTLAVEVVNLMANRIRYMDRNEILWQNYFFVNIDYKPFSASDWPVMPSGLAGPVNLMPLKTIF